MTPTIDTSMASDGLTADCKELKGTTTSTAVAAMMTFTVTEVTTGSMAERARITCMAAWVTIPISSTAQVTLLEYEGEGTGNGQYGGYDTVKSYVSHTLTNSVEKLELYGQASTGTGNALNNEIVGNSLNNTLYGLDGGDTLRGMGGRDTLHGGTGLDTLYGGDDNDWLYGGSWGDTLYGDNGNDTLDGGSNDDVMFGGRNDDTYIVGEAGDVVIETPVKAAIRCSPPSAATP